MDNFKVIDAHSHICYETNDYIIGANYMWKIIPTLDKYLKVAHANNIKIALFSPCTSPVIINKITKQKERLIVWDYNNNDFQYYHEYVDEFGHITRNKLDKNPYQKINSLLFEYLDHYPNYYFIPAINLIYDTVDYINELIYNGAVAFKCHGISIGLNDFNKINVNILKLLSKYDLPLVIHTDYSNNVNSPISKLYYANNPINWINLLRKYDVRGYLVHGCRLSSECAEILNSCSGQFLTGIAPDILMQIEKDRLYVPTDNYLKTLFEMFNEDILAFDIDFGWNIKSRESQDLDYNQLKRLNNVFSNTLQKEKVLYKNAQKFFRV